VRVAVTHVKLMACPATLLAEPFATSRAGLVLGWRDIGI
jgi:hypothetical protein